MQCHGSSIHQEKEAENHDLENVPDDSNGDLKSLKM